MKKININLTKIATIGIVILMCTFSHLKSQTYLGVSVSPLLDLNTNNNSFFSFKNLNEWSFHYRGTIVNANSEFFMNDKITFLADLGFSYSYSKNDYNGIILMDSYYYPDRMQSYQLNFGIGLKYYIWDTIKKFNIFISENLDLYYSFYEKFKFDAETKTNNNFNFKYLINYLGVGVRYSVSPLFDIYLKQNFLRIISYGDLPYQVMEWNNNIQTNIELGFNYKFPKK